MKATSPITATVIFGAAAALLVAAALSLPPGLITRLTAMNAALLLCLAAYAALLARMSATPVRALAAPFLMLSAVLPVASSVGGFALPAAAGLTWIRSGICFPGPAARRVVAEALTAGAGLALCAALRPSGAAGWALGLWMFFLFQALYFAVVDAAGFLRREPPRVGPGQALRRRTRALLREQKLERAFAEIDLSSRRGFDR
jgi:hypothetical protein